MTRSTPAATLLLATLLAIGSTGAMAQDRDRDHRGGPPDRHGPPPREAHHDDRQERGAGPDHDFRRGGRLPTQYRDHQYVVDDWRGHHLSAPPRGYHWVQTGPDYVLAAIATGVIAQVLLGN